MAKCYSTPAVASSLILFHSIHIIHRNTVCLKMMPRLKDVLLVWKLTVFKPNFWLRPWYWLFRLIQSVVRSPVTFSLSSRARHRRHMQQMMVTIMQIASKMMMVRKRPRWASQTDCFACGTGSSSTRSAFGGCASMVIGPICTVWLWVFIHRACNFNTITFVISSGCEKKHDDTIKSKDPT